jgi:pyruvate/2-oxoglutarate dehydrogenase complex dihydrolipoamide acyltransferase (E2) component
VRATPRARRLAQEHGLDLARVQTETGAEVIDEAVLQAYLKKTDHC